MAKDRALVVLDESQSTTKTIIKLAWPVFLEQILTTLVSYADTAMVGSLGAVATTSVSISNSPIMMLNGIVMSLGVGITTLVARSVGEGDAEKVKRLIRHAILAIAVIGLPICGIVLGLHSLIPAWMGADAEVLPIAAEYNLITGYGRIFSITAMMLNSAFRGYGDTKTPLVANTAMNVINVCFNFLFIYPTRVISLFDGAIEFTMWGAGMGVAGAAWATTIGMTFSGFITLGIAFFRNNPYKLSFKSSWKPDLPLIKQIFHISIPAMLERILMSSSGILVSSSIASLGTIAYAANSLTLTAESMSFMPAFAFQTAVTTLVGQSLGANKPNLAKKFVNRTMWMGCITMAVTTVGLFVLSSQLIGLFTPDQAVIDLGSQCLKVVAFMQVPQVATWILTGVLRGAGDTRICLYISAGTNWGIRTLLSVLAIRVFDMGIIECQFIILVEILVRLVLTVLRYRTGKWVNALERFN